MANLKQMLFIVIACLFFSSAAIALDTADAVIAAGEALQDTVAAKAAAAPATLKDSILESRPQASWKLSAGKFIWSAFILLIAFIGFRYLTKTLEVMAERWNALRLFVKRLIPIIRIAGWSVVLYFIIVVIFAPPIETLLAMTASAGIAVGFASQDILKNIFGGIMILFDRPFQVGDKIQVGAHYGEVIQIGLRTVRIVTPDDSVVSIPNSEIVNQSVSNANSGEFNCQVVAELYLPPDIDIAVLRQIAFRAAAVSRYVYLNKPIAVIIKNEIHEGRSLLHVRLKAYVLDLRYEFPFMSEMTEIVISELLNRGVVTAENLALMPGTIKRALTAELTTS